MKVIIDPGHGGIDDSGKYVTAPDKMTTFPDGEEVYEGVLNRQIASHLAARLANTSISFDWTVKDHKDVPLDDRCKIIKSIAQRSDEPVLVVSIHCNYYHDPNVHGWQIHTFKGYSVSDRVANIFCNEADKRLSKFTKMRWESPNDRDWDDDLAILRGHKYPSVLTENGFFSNRAEAQWIASDEGSYALANLHLEAIKRVTDNDLLS